MELLDAEQPLAWTQSGVLSAAECATLIARIEASGPDVATVNTDGGTELRPEIRNNRRVIFDDVPLARRIYNRLLPKLPTTLLGWHVHGLNERFRGYQYEPGQYFKPHLDGFFRRSPDEESMLTVLVYLNGDCEGGETALIDLDAVVAPVAGRALLFQHRVLHEGRAVTKGLKYVLRSDVMYRRRESHGAVGSVT